MPGKMTLKGVYRPLRGLSLLLLLGSQLSCSHALYYAQSIQGHLKIMMNQVDINQVIENHETDDEIRRKLNYVDEIRRFAIESLGLPDNGSYEKFTQLDRDYVVWNVIAAPELSLEPVRWCFLVVGCLPYRGYFEKESAIEFALDLERKGQDVYVGGVSAYSTLGWFKDPLLSSMLNRSDNDLAKVIFHELAHQKIYFTDDTEFNEAFADSVALIGIQEWLRSREGIDEFQKFHGENKREDEFVSLILTYKDKLNGLYGSELDREDKLVEKKRIFERLLADYQVLQTGWNGSSDYEDWFNHDLNNAKISTILTYRDLVPSFLSLYERQGRELQRFYGAVAAYDICTKEERKQRLIDADPGRFCTSGK
jgi:predicted aminopeptidase